MCMHVTQKLQNLYYLHQTCCIYSNMLCSQQAMAISCKLNTKSGTCVLNTRSSQLCWWRWHVLPCQLINWYDGDHLWAPVNTVMVYRKWRIHTFHAKVQNFFTIIYQWINIHQVSHPYKTTCNTKVTHISILFILSVTLPKLPNWQSETDYWSMLTRQYYF
jgi:hypothetical protein